MFRSGSGYPGKVVGLVIFIDMYACVTSQDAFAERSLVDIPTVGLKLIFEFVDRLVGENTVPQLYTSILKIYH